MKASHYSKIIGRNQGIRTLARVLPAVCCILAVLRVAIAAANAQLYYNYSRLYAFGGADGSGPTGTLIQGTDGNFYGTTEGSFGSTSTSADANTNGTVYSLTPAGVLTTLHVFAGTDGSHPAAALVQMPDGNLYGTTSGGFSGSGVTVFRLATDGTGFTTLAQGGSKIGTTNAWLARGSDGLLYGTDRQGGSISDGSIFTMTTDGTVTVIYSFAGQPDGEFPSGPLIQASDGNFYGCTGAGGQGTGTVYSITSAGVYTQLYALAASGTEGTGPNSLVQAPDGNFYATAQQGGDPNYPPSGTVFRVTPAGVFTKLFDLGSAFGNGPPAVVDSVSSLVVGPDGALYGTGKEGGETGTANGGVFRMTLDGVYSPVYAFDGNDGAYPFGAVLLGADGNFYGTTGGRLVETDPSTGGDQNGTIFEIALSAHAPFFNGETALAAGVYFLQFADGTAFGYYSYLSDPHYIYHFDLGYEYVFDAADGQNGVYLYDFASGSFFYTSPTFPFPYLYDFTLGTVLYYYPDAANSGHYTMNPRYFYDYALGVIFTQ